MSGKKMIREINSEEFKSVIDEKEKLILIDFHADWCGPCKMMMPIMTQVANDYRDKLTIFKIDIEKNPDVALEYRVLSIPTILVFKEGKLTGKIEGATTKAAMDMKKYCKTVLKFGNEEWYGRK